MQRSGLRLRMAVSYMLVTAAAVVLVEGVLLGILVPRILASSSRASQALAVAERANSKAKMLTSLAVNLAAHLPGGQSGSQLIKLLATSAQLSSLGLAGGRDRAARPGAQCLATANVTALISADGTVLATSSQRLCPVGERLGFAARPGLAGQGTQRTRDGQLVWAVSPVVYGGKGSGGLLPSRRAGKAAPGSAAPAANGGASPPALRAKRPVLAGMVLGGVYAGGPATSGGISFAQVRLLLLTGGVVLALLIPVGTVFGLLSTRRAIRRIERLAQVTATVAGGDFQPRVAVSGGDEIGRLEASFNQMTGRLSAAVDAQRAQAAVSARQAERARIARELHDSISQDLFSLSLLGAGLRKALGSDSALQPEVVALQETSARAVREMQALLLELRPVALEDAGLVPAVTELCQAYQARLAIKVTAELGEVPLGPAGEHAVLRIVQEALGNAARHGEPGSIAVRLGQRNGSVIVEVRDDGRGFDPAGVAGRHGMGLALMRERVTELGGDFRLDTAPGRGTAITVRLPAGPGGRS